MMMMNDDEDDPKLLALVAQSVASGCTKDQLAVYMNASWAGMYLREHINETIPEIESTLMMCVASRPKDDEETIRVAEALERCGAQVDLAAEGRVGSSPLNAAADFGKPRFLQWLIDRGANIEHHVRVSPSLPIYLSCQNNHIQCVGILVKAAVDQNKQSTLNSKSKLGKTPGRICMERGHPECMGALAMGGADLRQVTSTYWCPPPKHKSERTGNRPEVDPDPELQPQASMMQAILSFTTLQECVHCRKYDPNQKLLACTQCRMAHYCSRDCQKKDWKFHKHCCKKLRKGQDLVHKNDQGNARLPTPIEEPFGFVHEFSAEDHKERDNDNPDRPVWEYNAGGRGSPDWRRYPVRIEVSLESMLDLGSPRYLYRPGNPSAEGMYEPEPRSVVPPREIATNFCYFGDMVEREFYTGAIRAVRRNGSRNPPAHGC